MSIYASHTDPSTTPQAEQADSAQVENSAGGYSFVVDDWMMLQRFLILGSEGGTYYITERKLTKDAAKCVQRCLDKDSAATIEAIVEISQQGRAPKNSPAIFALAMAASHDDPVVRKLALSVLPKVCRIGTHLFEFLEIVKNFRGWGRGLRDAVGAWYATKDGDKLAYQLVKYQKRHDWTHRDALRKAHLGGELSPAVESALRWTVAGMDGLGKRDVKRGEVVEVQPSRKLALPHLIKAFEECKGVGPAAARMLIREHGLTREMVPTELLNDKGIWEALLERMPVTAMIRNLGKMTSVGLIAPMSDASKLVAERLREVDRLRKGRVHPLTLLAALKVYQQGRGVKGSLTWDPQPLVVDALDAAFYGAFKAIEPTGKRHLLALDVSGSMGTGVAGLDFMSCKEAAAAMALVTASIEPSHEFVAFSSRGWTTGSSDHGRWGAAWRCGIEQVSLSPRQRLDDVMRTLQKVPMGGTDCSLPMKWAQAYKVPVDVFCVYTDSETWAGEPHAHVALKNYRQKMGIDAKLVVVAMAGNEFTIADPKDGGMLDVVGFDTAAPRVIADFASY